MVGSILAWETPPRMVLPWSGFKASFNQCTGNPIQCQEASFFFFFGREMAQIHLPLQISVNPRSNLSLNKIRSLVVRPLAQSQTFPNVLEIFNTTCFGQLGSGAKDLRRETTQKDKNKNIKIMILDNINSNIKSQNANADHNYGNSFH